MSLKAELDTASNFNRKYYGRYFVNLSKRNPAGVCWIRCRYPLGRSHHINCKENLTECGECHNQRCSHSITKCMECEKSICNICAWTCELACKDQHLKGNMGEFQSCTSCKNTKPLKLPFPPQRNNMVTSPPINRFWWRKPPTVNKVGGYTNNMLENIRKQYLNIKNNNNNNNNNNNHNDNDNDNDNKNDNDLNDSNHSNHYGSGGDDSNENRVDNRNWWMKKSEKKWDSDYNNMIAQQKANYQQTLLSGGDDDLTQWDNDSVKTSEEDSGESDEEDNSSYSQNSDDTSGFVLDIRNKSSTKILYDWTDDDDEDIEQMWGNH